MTSRWNGPNSVYIETICRDDCPDEKIIIVCPQWFADKLCAKEISISIDRVTPPQAEAIERDVSRATIH